MRLISFFFLIFISLLGITFAGLNAEPVLLHYYIGEYQLPLSMLLVISLGAGLFIGLLFSILLFFRLKRQNFKLKSKLKIIEKEVDNLRSLPLRDS